MAMRGAARYEQRVLSQTRAACRSAARYSAVWYVRKDRHRYRQVSNVRRGSEGSGAAGRKVFARSSGKRSSFLFLRAGLRIQSFFVIDRRTKPSPPSSMAQRGVMEEVPRV